MNTKNLQVEKTYFGKTASELPVDIFTLRNASGVSAKVTAYGASLVELNVPDKAGQFANVVLGFDNLAQYESKDNASFGAIVGRVANRIAGGSFSLDDRQYVLAKNNGDNTLHGGLAGFGKRVWQVQEFNTTGGAALKCVYHSADMEEGFPGALDVSVIYSLRDDNSLQIDYRAVCDKATPVNLTNHAYFNLAAAGNGDVLEHELTIFAEQYTPSDGHLIPTGKIASVAGTPLDFRVATSIGSRIAEANGYDNNYVLPGSIGELKLAARAHDPRSGRTMEMHTTEPAVQLYTSNHFDGSVKGAGGVYVKYGAFCLEAQHFPDSIHQPGFPETVLRPGQEYSQTTIYRFF